MEIVLEKLEAKYDIVFKPIIQDEVYTIFGIDGPKVRLGEFDCDFYIMVRQPDPIYDTFYVALVLYPDDGYLDYILQGEAWTLHEVVNTSLETAVSNVLDWKHIHRDAITHLWEAQFLPGTDSTPEQIYSEEWVNYRRV
jgi:hypothetical protein